MKRSFVTIDPTQIRTLLVGGTLTVRLPDAEVDIRLSKEALTKEALVNPLRSVSDLLKKARA